MMERLLAGRGGFSHLRELSALWDLAAQKKTFNGEKTAKLLLEMLLLFIPVPQLHLHRYGLLSITVDFYYLFLGSFYSKRRHNMSADMKPSSR